MPDETPSWREREPHNVYEALSRITADLPAIGKDAKADPAQGGYAYRGIEHITSQIETLLALYGVVPIPELVGEPIITHITVNNKPWTDTLLRVRYRFVHGPSVPDKLAWDMEKGVEQLPPWCQVLSGGPDGFVGIGRDNSDKGANKAMTQAFKVCLIQTFVIGDKSSDADQGSPATDARGDVPRPPTPTLAEHFGYESEGHFEDVHRQVTDAWSVLVGRPDYATMQAWLAEQGHGRRWPLPPLLAKEVIDTASTILALRSTSPPAADDVSTTGATRGPSEAPEEPEIRVEQFLPRPDAADVARCSNCKVGVATTTGLCVVCEKASTLHRSPHNFATPAPAAPEQGGEETTEEESSEDVASSSSEHDPLAYIDTLTKGQVMLRLRDLGERVKGTERTQSLRERLKDCLRSQATAESNESAAQSSNPANDPAGE